MACKTWFTGREGLYEYLNFQGISFDEPIYVNSFPSPVNGKCVVAIISRADLPSLGPEARQYFEKWLSEPKTTERVVNLTDGPKVELEGWPIGADPGFVQGDDAPKLKK